MNLNTPFFHVYVCFFIENILQYLVPPTANRAVASIKTTSLSFQLLYSMSSLHFSAFCVLKIQILHLLCMSGISLDSESFDNAAKALLDGM
jgi:hypothetical protein